jgi:hypothetical protein
MNQVTYELIENPTGENYLNKIDTDGKVWFIPIDPANSDYQAYLATLKPETTKSK